MEIDEYISSLRNRNIIISVKNDSMAVNAPDDVLTSELVAELKSKKHEILTFFKTIKKGNIYESIKPVPKQSHYPLSSAQQRMYFLYELDKDGTAYNMPGFYRVSKNLNIEKLEQVFNDLSNRHHSLRTVFELVEGKPVQRILDTDLFELSIKQGYANHINDYIKDFVRPFDLSREFPFRVTLIDISGEDYLLMIDMHHIANDGISNEILMHDFWSLYHGFELPILTLQYTDYAVWQQSEAHNKLVSKHKDYWLSKFAEEPTALSLPTDYSRPKELGNVGELLSFEISEVQSKQLSVLAKAEGITMYTLFLTLFKILLAKLSNTNDIVIGTPTAGRYHADLEGIVGMFVNTLALRSIFASDKSFKEILLEVQQDTIEAFDHQLYQYDDLVKALDVSSENDRNPLFDVFYSFNQKMEESDLKNSELVIKNQEVPYNVSKFDLDLDVEDQGSNFVLRFTYNTQLFQKESIIRFSKYFENIMSQVLSDRYIKLSDICILSQEEKCQILHAFNSPPVDYSKKGTIIDLVEQQVFNSPTAEAICIDGDSMHYAEMNERANQLAHYLLQVLNVKKGDRVGLYLGRSSELLISILAVLKTGATYISLDPENPLKRINLLINNSKVQYILTNQSHELENVPSTAKIIDLNSQLNCFADMPIENPSIQIDENDPAYIIYTSGSTGNPKGVVISHNSLLDYSITFKDYFNLTSSDRVIQQASPAFDTLVEEVFPALITGAAVVIIKEGGKNIEALINGIKQSEATLLSTVPVVLEALNNYPEELSSLRTIISGGDVLLPRQIDNLFKHFEVFNTYGPSESTVCITYHRITDLQLTTCIGKPITNRQVYILNKDNQLCPLGVGGELYVAGKGLAKEYLDDEELTDAKFIDSPVSKGTRVYKTGDAAKWNSDGSIQFLGRVDDQVKIRGVRIELGEIESVLEELPAVDKSVVLAQGPENNKQLVAYWCGDKECSEKELRGFLDTKLPAYMVPTTFLWLNSLPLNANGKIDKKALPKPDTACPEEFIIPETETEIGLVTIWSEVLDVEKEKISLNADFFKLGGHSLNAITVSNKISEYISVHVALRELFTHRTIAELSQYIESIEKTVFSSIPKALDQAYYPLSPAQRRMYFLYELDKLGISYNMPGFYRLNKEMDVIAFNRAIHGLVNRHKSLRTIFELIDGSPAQSIVDASSFEIDYKQANPEDLDVLVSEFVRPFNLSSEIPYRVCLVDVQKEDYLLMIDSHHIINDGVSSDILMRDFWSLYAGNTLSKMEIDYIDYAVWQQGESHQEVIASHKQFWLDLYAKPLNSIELPVDHFRSKNQSWEGGTYTLQFSRTQSDAMRVLAANEGITMYTLFLGFYKVLLSKLSNQMDVVVGTPTAGRHHADLESVVGMFVNTLALRNEVDPKLTFNKFLKTLQANTIEAFDHQLYQYEDLVDSLDMAGDTTRNPIFDVFYSFTTALDSVGHKVVDGLGITTFDTKDHEIAKFELSLNISESDTIQASFNYRKDLFSAATIEMFSTYLSRIIDSILVDKSTFISNINILSKAEQNKLMSINSTVEASYDTDITVLEMFSNQVQLAPDSQALTMEGKCMTYKELADRSDLWASVLMQKIDKGSVVGLMMDRSFDMITGILAIMKAGGTYLPVNLDQPIARTTHMLEECEVGVVLHEEVEAAKGLKNQYETLTPKILDEQVCKEKLGLPIIRSEDIAYIIYTSGSTGKPKGVMVPQKGISNLIGYQKDFFGFDDTERVLQFSPYYFDASVEQIWLALTTGSTLVLVSQSVMADNKLLRNELLLQKVTHFHATPSYLEKLSIDGLPELKRVVAGGETCTASLAKKMATEYDFYNEYGPTETTVTSTIFSIKRGEEVDAKLPIGKPIGNTKLFVLGENKELLPQGVIGELYIGGLGLTNGYINNNVLTNERFIKNPFGAGKLYKTGDLVKWLPDGNLDYVGRNDNQVKLRGYRIELGEIESALNNISEIHQSLVVVHGSGDNKYLLAYLCGTARVGDEKINKLLSNELPDYMQPSAFLWVDSFPINANGKIDKGALPLPSVSDIDEYIAPNNEEEEVLVSIWSEVLGIESGKVSVITDFFRLGGHSLNAITVSNKISEFFSVEVPLKELFTYRTISELAEFIGTLEKIDFIHIPTVPNQAYYPLSSAQRRMYFLYQYDKEGVNYNMPSFYTVSRDLDISAFNRSIESLVQRHISLRTVIDVVDGLPVQRLLDANQFEVDYKQASMEEKESVISEFVRPFNLAADYPYRVCLVDLRGDDYLLMIDTHHIINDGVSNTILMRDFWSFYKGIELPDLRIQYVDYAVWQQSEEHQALITKHKEYWLAIYEESVSVLELPTDYERPLRLSNEGNTLSICLNKELSDRLKAYAQSNGVTMYTLFFAAYNVLLNKLSNQTDIIVGTPVAGRHHIDLEEVVGMFVNTLPLRNSLDVEYSFKKFLKLTEKNIVSGFDHQLYPYEELVETLNLPRTTNRNSLFDVFFSYQQDNNSKELGLNDITITGLNDEDKLAKFDFSMAVHDGQQMELQFSYRTDLYKEANVRRVSEYFEIILNSILNNEDTLIKDINILSSAERMLLLNGFNTTFNDFDAKQTVLDLFKKHVELTPELEALHFGNLSMSYGELDVVSDKWAKYLVNSGTGSEDIVGILMNRSVDMIVGILAILKTGAAYLPLNPDQPISRTNYMLEECSCNILVTNISKIDISEFDEKLHIISSKTLNNETVDKSINLPTVTPDNLAYVIYTSGSTGKPKGVKLHHQGLYNLINSHINYFQLGDNERILQFSPYYFDASVEQIWMALTSGSGLVLIEQGTISDPRIFNEYIRNRKVTHIHATPSFLGKADLKNLPDLKRIASGGEACTPSLVNKITKNYEFYNEYGPTEITVLCTIFKVDIGSTIEGRVPIGSPIANTQLYVLDENLQLPPQGVIGELYIGGKGVSSGYIGKSLLTEERFISNPFGKGKVYKTGDLVRWREDGNLEYCGRNDDQVKVRGYRIELEEIIIELEAHPAIDKALVTVYGETDKNLIAYYSRKSEIDDEELQSYLMDKLPEYMIPVKFISLEDFPLNSNGKVDKKALPAPNFTDIVEYVAPETETEKELIKVWSKVLQLDEQKISIKADFFKLGGHSLNAITVANKVNQLLAVEVPLRELFTYRTVSELSVFIDSLDKTSAISIPKAPEQDYYPLSSAQNRMYFLYEYDKTSISYNIPVFYEIEGNLDLKKFSDVFKQIVNRHESFRTSFIIVDGVPQQQVIEGKNFEVKHYDENEVSLNNFKDQFVRPFDLSKELPIRVSLMKLKENGYLLALDTHHIVNDGASMQILVNEFWSLYDGLSLNLPNLQYKDYAFWQQSEVYKGLIAKSKSFWLDVYQELITPLDLPTDYERPLLLNDVGGAHTVTLSNSLTEKLKIYASNQGVTMFNLFLAAYKVLLNKLSNKSDLIVGTPVSGRHHVDLEGVVGLFVNTLALRNKINDEDTFANFLQTLNNNTLNAFNHHLFPYEELVDAIELDRNTDSNSLFDVFFSYNREIDTSDIKDKDLTIMGHSQDNNVVKFDIDLSVAESEEISISLAYRSALFQHDTIVKFTDYLIRILECVSTDGSKKLKHISILSEQEESILINDFNSIPVNYDCESTVLDLFTIQAKENPDKVALEQEFLKITYKELDQISDKWAQNLITLGIRKNDVVGMLMDRSFDMITGILAIFKAGATYLPLNTAQPVGRTKYMLEECDCKYLISNLELTENSFKGIKLVGTEELNAYDLDAKRVLPNLLKGDLAYIIYTSGSTGKPKGVKIHHEAISNLIKYQTSFFQLGNEESILQFSPFYFDASVEQIWLALTTGSSLVLINDLLLSDPESMRKYVDSKGITHIHATPSYLEKLNFENLPKLKRVVAGGEACSKNLAEKITKAYDFYNEYGPTETTVTSTILRIKKGEKIGEKLSIGNPIGNTYAFILNTSNELMPKGAIGELFLGGKGVSTGYINNKLLTEERFITNPFGPGKLYATGDLARWNSEGNLEYHGRNDDQIKLRGYRIELGEIARVLEENYSVDKAVVIVYGQENKRLIAYLIGDSNTEVAKIENYMSENLPDYMIPSQFIWQESFTLNSNGKIDKTVLPAPEFSEIAVFEGAANELQSALVSIWSKVLDIEENNLSIHADFFKLGGNSLNAITINNKVNQLLSMDIPLRELFVHTTIANFSEIVEHYNSRGYKENTIVQLDNRNLDTKLFIIHDGSAEIDGYLELVRRIDGFSCYGIRFDPEIERFESQTISQIAQYYIKEIKLIQPEGPYNLLGWSLGGVIANEITHQLESVNQEVENLIMIDSYFNFKPQVEYSTFSVESELALLRSKFGFIPTSETKFTLIQEVWKEFSVSETFQSLSINDLMNSMPTGIEQLIPDIDHMDKDALLNAINKIRLLTTASNNHHISGTVKARSLFIEPSVSQSIPDKEKLQKYFNNISVKNINGDHFSVMKNPKVIELSRLINFQLESEFVG